VEAGQGARAEISQAAAEELRVPLARIQAIMADTSTVPDDGITAGSGTTPRTLPAVRQAAAAARNALIEYAAQKWSVDPKEITIQDGAAHTKTSNDTLSYPDLAVDEEAAKTLQANLSGDISLTRVKEWSVLGRPTTRPNARDLVTGSHKYPSDIQRPGMLYGRVLRAPSYGAKLISLDLAPAGQVKGSVPIKDGDFVGVAAPNSFLARQAIGLIGDNVKWETAPHPSSKQLFEHLKKNAEGGLPENPFAAELANAKQSLKQVFTVAYAQHAPLEPRAAVAEWNNDQLTVWTGTQNPFGCRGELARAFHIPEDKVRVIVPDFGSGFGGKHTGECAVEAARLAKAAGKPVSLRWTRREEFTWAYFRPAAYIQVEAGLDDQGQLSSWYFVNVNSGGAALETPYRAGKSRCQFIGSQAPLRHGSYRALASTANNFARESFMDELAALAKLDPLDFRLAHIENPRLRAVLATAAAKFGWKDSVKEKKPEGSRPSAIGYGLACGTEKGSYVAACVEIQLDSEKAIKVKRITQAFDCGPIMNPSNLRAQVQGAIIMGLGPALREEMTFERGEITNPTFRQYQVPRFADVPELDIHLLDRPDLDPSGAGETPIIAIAPAIANAVFFATGERIRSMPIQLGA